MSSEVVSLVHKYVEGNPGAVLSTDRVLEHILQSTPRLKRKPQAPLRKAIEKALIGVRAEAALRTQAPQVGSKRAFASSTEGSSSKKTRGNANLSELQAPPVSMLNASLTRSYTNNSNKDKVAEKGPKKSKGGKKARKRKNRIAEHTIGPSDALNAAVSSSHICERPLQRYSDLAGIDSILQSIREQIEYPLTHPEIYSYLGIQAPRGILLHGPPGCGKTLLAHAIGGELGDSVTFMKLSAPEVVTGVSGESEQKLRALFREAAANAPTIIFIDEIDAVCPKRSSGQRGMERRIVAQLLSCIDNVADDLPVLVLGVTGRPADIDTSLRRAGRFDREICVGVPDITAREGILKTLTRRIQIAKMKSTQNTSELLIGKTDIEQYQIAMEYNKCDIDYSLLAKKTPGYVGADLSALIREAAIVCVNRIFSELIQKQNLSNTSQMNSTINNIDNMVIVGKENNIITDDTVKTELSKENSQNVQNSIRKQTENSRTPFTNEELALLSINMNDFLIAIGKVQPSAKREGFATVPGVTWADVGALSDVREELHMSILNPIKCPERFEALGLSIPAGVLLYGPPGCGKTLLAKAIANESGANFIAVKGPELLDKYVGESEKAVRVLFQRAATSAPCIIFFDELDALAPKRGSGGGGGGGVSERVVNQLLTELDGLDTRRDVFVIAATNRPDIIDSAMLRPGRLDKLLYVPLPSPAERVEILRTLTRNTPLSSDVDIEGIGHDQRCDCFSGADLQALVREAAMISLRASFAQDLQSSMTKSSIDESSKNVSNVVTMSNFISAFPKVSPSVSKREQKSYLKLRDGLRKANVSDGMSKQ